MSALCCCAPWVLFFLGQVDRSPTPDEIAAAVRRLGAERYQERQEATEFLWRAGEAAVPALREAAQSQDAEVRLRAHLVLEDFKYGLTADTPAEAAALVQRFRRGDRTVQRTVLRALLKQGHIANVVAILRAANDDALHSEFLIETESLVPQLLAEGRLDQAEAILALAADPDRSIEQGQRNYAAFLLLRGRLDAKLSELQAAGPSDDRQAGFIARLLQAQGDYAAALPLARQAKDQSLVAELLFQQGDWRAIVAAGVIPGDPGVERLGFSALLHRLADDRRQEEEALAALEKQAEENPDDVWMCGEALMINGSWNRAQRLFAQHSPSLAFDLHASHLRYAEAFRAAGIDDPRKGADEWFSLRVPAMVKGSQEIKDHVRLGLKAASLLHRLGEEREASRLFEEIALTTRNDSSLSMAAVIEAELKLGLRGRARERLVATLPLPNVDRKALMSTWFSKHSALARFWWEWLRDRRNEESEAETFARLERLLAETSSKRTSADTLASLLDDAQRGLSGKPPAERGETLEMLGELCLLHERRDLARRFFEQRTQIVLPISNDPFGPSSSPRSDALLRMGDLLAEENNWREAAVWYRRAWEADRRQSLALYLEGIALQQIGNAADGKSRRELASLVCLADVQRRGLLADGLDERSQPEAAIEQWRWVMRLGPANAWEGSHAWAVSRALRQIGNHVSQNAPQEAAEHWRRWFSYLLKTNSAFLEMEYYSRIAHLIHKTRARGLAAVGDWRAAVAEIRLAQAALPGDIDLPLDLVPRLIEAGHSAEAEEIFRAPFDLHRRLVEQFPASATHHNNLAWLAARCDRELDLALQHANRAVALSPDKASFLDTLAEVHFRRGDPIEAIRLIRRCLEMEPTNEYFLEQLTRFEKGL